MDQMMERREFVRRLLAGRGDLLVVCGLGSPTYDVAAAGDHPLNLYLWGAMGGAAMIGLGLALARPDRRVAVLTGDGEALMGLGSLATIGVKQPANLAIVVLDNQHYGETGMQPSHTSAGIDLVATALACKFAQAQAISDIAEAGAVRDLLHGGRGPILVQARIACGDTPRVLPSRDGHAIKLRFVEALGASSR
ncbi:MAG TPA: thiamine pyrophosphate-dependent enzyme [Xanthobacteraceae bacterium]|jgi:thiamine pyrophosphate-dependent acetolactate synthase large subunit-like protein|nr:thiamine pyrophosphate-dependent enzyme [Xanthobacteraceae bacterium]